MAHAIGMRPRLPCSPRSTQLTTRQFIVAQQVARGLTNAEIADELVLTEGTVANHVQAALQRLGLRNRVELAVWAVRQEDGTLSQLGDGIDGGSSAGMQSSSARR